MDLERQKSCQVPHCRDERKRSSGGFKVSQNNIMEHYRKVYIVKNHRSGTSREIMYFNLKGYEDCT